MVEQALAATTDDWAEILAEVYAKKFSAAESMDSNEQAKRSRFLLQRGFSGANDSRLIQTINPIPLMRYLTI